MENYCPEVKFNLGLLFIEALLASVNSKPRLNFTKGTIIFYRSPNKRAVNTACPNKNLTIFARKFKGCK